MKNSNKRSFPSWLWALIGSGSTLILLLAGVGLWSLSNGNTISTSEASDLAIANEQEVVARAKQSEPKSYLASTNKGQQAFFIEQGRFSDSIDELGTGIKTETNNYSYKIVFLEPQQIVQIVGIAKRKELKSYTGIVQVKRGITVAILCESNEPTTVAPSKPLFAGDGRAVCPNNYSKL